MSDANMVELEFTLKESTSSSVHIDLEEWQEQFGRPFDREEVQNNPHLIFDYSNEGGRWYVIEEHDVLEAVIEDVR